MKKKFTAALFSILFLASNISFAATYEYLVIRLGVMNATNKKHTKVINKYALEGWRLVDVVNYDVATFLYFEKEVK